MKIFLVDDHHLFRSGLRMLLSGLQEGIEFVETGSIEELIDYDDKTGVDLIMLDLNLPGARGIDYIEQIKQLYDCSIVMLSSEDDPNIIRQAIANGASGFIPKSSSPEVLVAAMQLILANGIYLPPHVLNAPDDMDKGDASVNGEQREAILKELSDRQLDVLIRAAQGKPNKVIARELHIAEGTVKAHLSACYRALGVDNRTEAVYATASLGLVPES